MSDYTIKQIGGTLVAGIRFQGEFTDIPDAFRKLHDKVAPHISGDAMCLWYGQPAEGCHDLEVCYPVTESVEGDGIVSRHLERYDVLSFPTEGTRESAEAVWDILWPGASESVDERNPDAPPFAILYLEEGDEIKEGTVRLAIELLMPPSTTYWLAALGKGVMQFAGDEVRERVMAGVEAITLDTPRDERTSWIVGALERLEAEVADEETRSRILRCSSHRFPSWRIEQMKDEYERLGSIDALLAVMHMDRSVDGYSWYCQQIRVGDVIYTTKDPLDREGYKNAETALERRMAACFCGLVKEHMRSGGQVPFTHCYCGAGWAHQLWEGILGKPVKVEILTSVLQGDDICAFAIHLPEGD